MRYECAVCGRRISPRYWVCSACREAHGLTGPFREWPDWAKACKADEQERRRDEERYLEREEQDDDIDDVWDMLAPNEGDQWYDWGHAARADDEPVRYLRTGRELETGRRYDRLPTGPYPTEELNRQYRLANGIKS